MADIDRTIAVIFKGTDQLSGTIGSLSSSLDKFGANVQNVTQPLADMAESVLKIEAGLAALAVGGLAASVVQAGKFTSSFGEISTLINATDDELTTFQGSILDYARTSTASIEDLNGAVYTAISAGQDWKDVISDFIPVAEALSTAGLAPLESTTRLLASTMNAYGEGIYTAQQASDIFFTTVRLGQTTIPELAQSMAQVSSIAATAGVPLETMAAAISALTAGGMDTAQAITSLKAIITTIIAPTSQTAEAAKALGIEFNASALASKGLEGILQEVAATTGGSAEKIAELFTNVRALGGAAALTGTQSDAFLTALEQMRNAGGATAEALAKVAQSFENVNQNLVNNIKATMIELGVPLLEQYVNIANQISSVFDGLSVAFPTDAFSEVYDLINGFGVEVEDLLKRIAEIIGKPDFWETIDWAPLLDSVRDLGQSLSNAFEAIFGDIDLTTPEGLEAAIEKVINGLSNLTYAASGIIDSWEPFLKTIGSAITAFTELDSETAKTSGQFLGFGQAINQVAGLISPFTDGLKFLAYTMGAGSLLKGIGAVVTALGTSGAVTIGAGGLIGGFATATLALAGFAASWESWFNEGQSFEETAAQIKNEFLPGINALIDGFKGAAYELGSLGQTTGGYTDDMFSFGESVDSTTAFVEAYNKTLRETPKEVKTEISAIVLEKAKADLGLFSETLLALGEGSVDILVEAEVNEASALDARDFFVETIYKNGEPIVVISEAQPNIKSIQDTNAALATIPTEKQIEIKLQGQIDTEIAKIKADAETIQTLVEWKAKLDIAEAEAAAEKFIAASELISDSFVSTGEVLGSLFDTYADSHGLKALNIENWIKAESERRDKLLSLEVDLVEAEIKLTEAKAKAVDRGESLISITADGLEPELEAFMMAILKRIQIRAAESDSTYLLGV